MNHMPAYVHSRLMVVRAVDQRARSGRGFACPSISNHIERYCLSLVEPVQPRALDRADVHKDVLAAVVRLGAVRV
jgi:hypothetical protein